MESVENLLAYLADPNVASDGVEPPLCVAVRHRGGALSVLSWSLGPTSTFARPPLLLRMLAGLQSAASRRWNWRQGDECMMDLLNNYHLFQADVSTSAFDI